MNHGVRFCKRHKLSIYNIKVPANHMTHSTHLAEVTQLFQRGRLPVKLKHFQKNCCQDLTCTVHKYIFILLNRV